MAKSAVRIGRWHSFAWKLFGALEERTKHSTNTFLLGLRKSGGSVIAAIQFDLSLKNGKYYRLNYITEVPTYPGRYVY